MELWIRSQDKKKLCNAKSFELDNNETGIFCNNYEDGYIFAGRYRTKERALEVLDEIQSALDVFLNSDYLKNVTDVSKQVYIAPFIVYEMPKE